MHTILKPRRVEVKGLLRRPRRRWEDIDKMDLKDTGYRV
jgi:hypothetical protein